MIDPDEKSIDRYDLPERVDHQRRKYNMLVRESQLANRIYEYLSRHLGPIDEDLHASEHQPELPAESPKVIVGFDPVSSGYQSRTSIKSAQEGSDEGQDELLPELDEMRGFLKEDISETSTELIRESREKDKEHEEKLEERYIK